MSSHPDRSPVFGNYDESTTVGPEFVRRIDAATEAIRIDGRILASNSHPYQEAINSETQKIQYGFCEGIFLGISKFPELNRVMDEIGARYGGVNSTTIAIVWLLLHLAGMQPISGTMNRNRLKDCLKASEIWLTREEWYAIFRAVGNVLP